MLVQRPKQQLVILISNFLRKGSDTWVSGALFIFVLSFKSTLKKKKGNEREQEEEKDGVLVFKNRERRDSDKMQGEEAIHEAACECKTSSVSFTCNVSSLSSRHWLSSSSVLNQRNLSSQATL